jgi:hypothetical protein
VPFHPPFNEISFSSSQNLFKVVFLLHKSKHGTITEGGRLSTAGPLIKIASIATKVNNIFNEKPLQLN